MAPDGPSERMRETLKSPYDEDGDFWTALFNAFSEEFAEYEDALEQVETNKFVDTANAGSLERLATIFDIQRQTTESVAEFRARLKTALRSQITSATVNEIEAVTAVILGADRSEIAIIEPSDFSPAFIELDLPEFSDELDASRVIEIVELVTAAGVEVGIRVVTSSESVVVMNDGFEVGPFAENDLPEGIAVFDESQVEPFDGLDKPDGLSLGDAEQTEPFDGLYRPDAYSVGDAFTVGPTGGVDQSEGVSVGDEARNRTDAVEEAYWNEGIWGVNFWHTFEQLPDETFGERWVLSDAESARAFDAVGSDSLVLTDDGRVVERDAVSGDTLVLTDVGSVVERDSVAGDTLGLGDEAEIDGPPETEGVGVVDVAVFDDPPETEGVSVSDTAELDDPPETEGSVVTDEVTVTPQPTAEYYWDEGIWGFGVWSPEPS